MNRESHLLTIESDYNGSVASDPDLHEAKNAKNIFKRNDVIVLAR